MLVIDIETKDPGLNTEGAGTKRGTGKILGVAICDGKSSHYFPPTAPQLTSLLASNETKVFHNGIYDLEWLNTYGYQVNGTYRDTLIRAALIAPDADHFSLDSCCKRMGLEGKNKGQTIEQWWTSHGGKGKAVEHLDEIPTEVVADYACQDVKATWDLYHKQQTVIEQMHLERVDMLESDLMPMVLEMRHNGIRIDEQQRDVLRRQYLEDVIVLEDDILAESGIVNINSSDQIAYFFHEQGIHSQFVTATGGESWDKDALAALNHPVADKIIKAKSKKTVLGTFLSSALMKTVNGRIYTDFLQTGRDEGGTVTGRFSSQHPNLQNIPSAEDKGGKELRALFLPDEGCMLGAFDYKQIEYRLFAHYAIAYKMPGWEELKKAMAEGKDYHKWVLEMLGWDDSMRKIAKTLNFGILYGMGMATCLRKNRRLFIPRPGETVEEYAKWVYDTYFKTLKFVKPTCKHIQTEARNAGYVTSYGGRRHPTILGKDYVSVNKQIQGGAADILKAGMVKAYQQGITKYLPVHLTVHDELVFSIPRKKESKEAMMALKEAMIVNDLEVPIDVDTEIGTNWADVNLENYNVFSY